MSDSLKQTVEHPKLTNQEKKQLNKKLYKKVQKEESKALATRDKQLLKGEVTNGRPTTYTDALGAEVCAMIADGASLRTVCKAEHLPAKATIFRWLGDERYSKFRDQYTSATIERSEAMHEDILDIADDGSNDWMDRFYGNQQEWVTNGEALARSKLRVETRRWLMEKMKPKKYGNKLDLTSGGKDLPTPILGIMQAQNTQNDTIADVKPRKFIDPGAENAGDISKPLTTDDIKD